MKRDRNGETARAGRRIDIMRAKHPRGYYLDGLTAVFQPGVPLPGTLCVDQKLSSAEVVLLNPGPNAVEVLGILRHGRMPSAAELEVMLRPLWKWAAPVIARAISSRKDVPGYADNRYTNARHMARDIIRSYGKKLASFDSEKSTAVPGTEGVPASPAAAPDSDALLFQNSNEGMPPPDDKKSDPA